MTTTAAPKSISVARDVTTGGALAAAGIGCLILFALSDARGKVSFPPDDSLFSTQNWFQAAAIVVGGLLIAAPRVPKTAKAAAGGVVLICAGLVFGTAVWAIKHWVPHGGIAGLDPMRAEEMTDLAVMVAVAALAAAILAFWWLARSGVITRSATKKVRNASVVAGVITIVAVPPMIGIGSGNAESLDVTSLGTFALLFTLPWGLSFIIGAYLLRPAALGALSTATASMTWWIVAALIHSELVLAAGFGLVLLTSGWLITLHWRSTTTTLK